MNDRFDEMMRLFLKPLSELGGRITDSTYFLRKDGSFVFAQGYYHPAGMLSGKIIYFPEKGGWVDIFGREYGCMHKKYVNGRMYSYTNPEQIAMHYELFPGLKRNARVAPIIKNNLLFPLDDFVGFFEPRNARKTCMELYPKVRRGLEAASELLDVPLDRMGLTGSLQYGRLEEHDDDTDIIFYGSVEENYVIMQKIMGFVRRDPRCHVHEFDKFWPMRMYHGGILLCPFFVYAREEEIPVSGNCTVTPLKEEPAQLTGRITDIRHSIYMPLVFPLEDVDCDGERLDRFILILSDSYVRGEFEVGQRLKTSGELVRVDKGGESCPAMIVANNWDVQEIR